ncbi:hypothetical protein TREMEDRAFT_64473 [Tremella mesenterica DSM 1558]|uniref:uncharacterized protein n=1 Tax=Tremella mesenterica (strain ATCC 24925 / CBS 8224 / DSM 1558 / NBRC 9311 / NRRL Y-6157 / RJB 2259-6 / UBC 559-6) TaxID=578456 RepID=UPI0003F4A2D4|nr:uncharacterized protein TREMEDRAFT_64473 [Tremella mesenterica DSM 1558]EIW67227.1 hypothetical protein TREMEDRAFT_64473 [Tremella mesenterica DSM 1558]
MYRKQHVPQDYQSDSGPSDIFHPTSRRLRRKLEPSQRLPAAHTRSRHTRTTSHTSGLSYRSPSMSNATDYASSFKRRPRLRPSLTGPQVESMTITRRAEMLADIAADCLMKMLAEMDGDGTDEWHRSWQALVTLRQAYILPVYAPPFPLLKDLMESFHPHVRSTFDFASLARSVGLSSLATFVYVILVPDEAGDLLLDIEDDDGASQASGGKGKAKARELDQDLRARVRRRNRIMWLAWKKFWLVVVPATQRDSESALRLWLDFATQIRLTYQCPTLDPPSAPHSELPLPPEHLEDLFSPSAIGRYGQWEMSVSGTTGSGSAEKTSVQRRWSSLARKRAKELHNVGTMRRRFSYDMFRSEILAFISAEILPSIIPIKTSPVLATDSEDSSAAMSELENGHGRRISAPISYHSSDAEDADMETAEESLVSSSEVEEDEEVVEFDRELFAEAAAELERELDMSRTPYRPEATDVHDSSTPRQRSDGQWRIRTAPLDPTIPIPRGTFNWVARQEDAQQLSWDSQPRGAETTPRIRFSEGPLPATPTPRARADVLPPSILRKNPSPMSHRRTPPSRPFDDRVHEDRPAASHLPSLAVDLIFNGERESAVEDLLPDSQDLQYDIGSALGYSDLQKDDMALTYLLPDTQEIHGHGDDQVAYRNEEKTVNLGDEHVGMNEGTGLGEMLLPETLEMTGYQPHGLGLGFSDEDGLLDQPLWDGGELVAREGHNLPLTDNVSLPQPNGRSPEPLELNHPAEGHPVDHQLAPWVPDTPNDTRQRFTENAQESDPEEAEESPDTEVEEQVETQHDVGYPRTIRTARPALPTSQLTFLSSRGRMNDSGRFITPDPTEDAQDRTLIRTPTTPEMTSAQPFPPNLNPVGTSTVSSSPLPSSPVNPSTSSIRPTSVSTHRPRPSFPPASTSTSTLRPTVPARAPVATAHARSSRSPTLPTRPIPRPSSHVDPYLVDEDGSPLQSDPTYLVPRDHIPRRSRIHGQVSGQSTVYSRISGRRRWTKDEELLLYRTVQKVPLAEEYPLRVVWYLHGEYGVLSQSLAEFNPQHMKDKMRVIVTTRLNNGRSVEGRARYWLRQDDERRKELEREIKEYRKRMKALNEETSEGEETVSGFATPRSTGRKRKSRSKGKSRRKTSQSKVVTSGEGEDGQVDELESEEGDEVQARSSIHPTGTSVPPPNSRSPEHQKDRRSHERQNHSKKRPAPIVEISPRRPPPSAPPPVAERTASVRRNAPRASRPAQTLENVDVTSRDGQIPRQSNNDQVTPRPARKAAPRPGEMIEEEHETLQSAPQRKGREVEGARVILVDADGTKKRRSVSQSYEPSMEQESDGTVDIQYDTAKVVTLKTQAHAKNRTHARTRTQRAALPPQDATEEDSESPLPEPSKSSKKLLPLPSQKEAYRRRREGLRSHEAVAEEGNPVRRRASRKAAPQPGEMAEKEEEEDSSSNTHEAEGPINIATIRGRPKGTGKNQKRIAKVVKNMPVNLRGGGPSQSERRITRSSGKESVASRAGKKKAIDAEEGDDQAMDDEDEIDELNTSSDEAVNEERTMAGDAEERDQVGDEQSEVEDGIDDEVGVEGQLEDVEGVSQRDEDEEMEDDDIKVSAGTKSASATQADRTVRHAMIRHMVRGNE